jgi:hypothetical protein
MPEDTARALKLLPEDSGSNILPEGCHMNMDNDNQGNLLAGQLYINCKGTDYQTPEV